MKPCKIAEDLQMYTASKEAMASVEMRQQKFS